MNALVLSGLLLGLFGGAHCVAMCGGIVSVVCGGAARCGEGRERGARPRLLFALLYNLGRVLAYALAGALLGGVGGIALAQTQLDFVRYLLRALAGLSMLAAGLHLVGLPSLLGRTSGGAVWRRVAPFATRRLAGARPIDAFVLGLLWGLMPCGLLYGAFALAASARSAGEGALTMLAFGIGTLPVMLTLSALAQTIARWLAQKAVRRLAGVAILGFGLFTISGLVRQLDLGAHHCCPRPTVFTEHARQ